MPLSIHRLRIWLLMGLGLLVLVIAGFLGYARYRTHRFLAELPAKLGVDIRRETNGYTYSQSIKGKTVMTLHASKAVEHANGKFTLHDVSMTLFGRKQDRMDHISGSEFEYDQGAGVVRAVGEVHIDLETPGHAQANKSQGKEGKNDTRTAKPSENDKQIVHVKTSGLIYLQKLGVAATDQELEFQFGGMTGHAKGAEYNSDTGVLVLQAAMKVAGEEKGLPFVLTASHAELERVAQRVLLTQASYGSPDRTIRGDHAIVHLRSDGSPERIEADGNVALVSVKTGSATAPHADVLFSEAGQARNAHLFGGVQFEEKASLREAKGRAKDAQIVFDALGQAQKVMLAGEVNVNERTRATEAMTSPWTVRNATAEKMSFDFVDNGAGNEKLLHDVDASSAHVTLISNVGAPATATSELSGDTLHGDFTRFGKTVQLSSLHGTGHTFLCRRSARGDEQSSTGDVLDVTLRQSSKSVKGSTREEIARAVQAGHVVLTSKSEPKKGSATPVTTYAEADLGVYDGDADHLTLTGHAQVKDGQNNVFADRIVMEHASGDVTADGSVKASYPQPNAPEPLHVVAARAELKRDSNRIVFYGVPNRAARLWQGASQVEAPVLDLDRQQLRLTAHGDGADATPVHAVLSGSRAAAQGNNSRTSVVRIASHMMVYNETARQVDFTGAVRVDDVNGVLHARQATVYLQSASVAGAAASKGSPVKDAPGGAFFGGNVECIVASGQIEIEQTSRRATGERLVYTAGDGTFVLTGTPSMPPKLLDEVQGSVTGTTLRFRTGDDSVEVAGDPGNPSRQVHTVTRVRQK